MENRSGGSQKNNDGKLVGRIAAFVNKKYKNKGDDVPIGGVGFFDCINNQQVADMLFDVAKHWLSQKGMEAMDGPINFGNRSFLLEPGMQRVQHLSAKRELIKINLEPIRLEKLLVVGKVVVALIVWLLVESLDQQSPPPVSAAEVHGAVHSLHAAFCKPDLTSVE